MSSFSKGPCDLLASFHLVALKPFATRSPVSGIQLRFTVQRFATGLDFSFDLTGDTAKDLEKLVMPSLKGADQRKRRDELWRRTCFEIFFGPVSDASYFEMNISPAGDWNLYAFDGYRTGMRPVSNVEVPIVSFCSSPSKDSRRWRVEMEPRPGVDGELSSLFDPAFSADSERVQAPPLVLGATAVLEYVSGEFEYWALAHTDSAPDFHSKQSFVLAL